MGAHLAHSILSVQLPVAASLYVEPMQPSVKLCQVLSRMPVAGVSLTSIHQFDASVD